jgi:hypothetical protein
MQAAKTTTFSEHFSSPCISLCHASHLLPMLDLSILDNCTSACVLNKIVESFRLGVLLLLMEKGAKMIRCLTTPEMTRTVLHVLRDELLRDQRANIDDDDEKEVEDSGEEMEEEKDNVRMIVQEIRRAIGA